MDNATCGLPLMMCLGVSEANKRDRQKRNGGAKNC
jgi:hypothetical protein